MSSGTSFISSSSDQGILIEDSSAELTLKVKKAQIGSCSVGFPGNCDTQVYSVQFTSGSFV